VETVFSPPSFNFIYNNYNYNILLVTTELFYVACHMQWCVNFMRNLPIGIAVIQRPQFWIPQQVAEDGILL
jgi:hypothetical protein